MIKTLSAPIAVATVPVVMFCLLLLAIASDISNAAEIKILSGRSVKPVMNELIPQFERSSGHKVTIDYAPTAPFIVKRIEEGETVDVAIATRQGIAKLVERGSVTANNAADIAKVGVGAMVRKGAPKPDIRSVETFKRALLAAKSIGHPDPRRGGRTAVYISGLLGRLDIAADIKPKITIYPPGVYESIAKGDVEIGFALTTEILAYPGVELVGPLPAEIQNYTVFKAGTLASSNAQTAGKALIHFLTSPAAIAVWRANGYERP